jgi:hypothetical protein
MFAGEWSQKFPQITAGIGLLALPESSILLDTLPDFFALDEKTMDTQLSNYHETKLTE